MAESQLRTLAYAVAYATFALGLGSLILRVYCRLTILRAWGWDDYFAIFVGVVSCGQQIVLHLFLYWGCGLHVNTLTVEQQLGVIKILFVEEVYYYFVHWVIKSAFLFFYLRLSPKKTFRMFVFIGMATNMAIFIANTLIAVLQCTPFDEIFHPGTHPDAKCLHKIILLIVPSVLNIIEDIYILVIPISTVLGLQMSIRRKIGVLSVISFGASTVLVALLRLIPLVELNSSADFSYVLGKIVVVAAFEIQLAIIAINLPSMKALWLRLTGGGSSSGSNPGRSKDGRYKLSSMKGASQDLGTIGGSSRQARRNKLSRGSITHLEHDVRDTDSQEELFRQAGYPIDHDAEQADSGIVVTTELTQSLEEGSPAPGSPFHKGPSVSHKIGSPFDAPRDEVVIQGQKF
ncbi:hypothetical protein P153DRAFT_220463 [Dothidotthia symphoricarpi CBS 119687]|uniref:Rhodopsin domain-containing protein n=1 Tax=Dothidotthia symphoricarpi CBS 119687 TaxID=1392245 RepID=A0A6A6AHH6_9PLEO|nr:uncharacterized protein P153DRAFT_220463 [Dothidotthia symphoricarpi CBS 119687]KAF2130545.1 hypothetical protein P153DRAFT_220463 [Dothidotthia symphoricarpi CBS 119687]